MTAVNIIRWVHIASGVVALGAFWIPLVARKGSPLHRRAGWVYACAMGAAAVAAWVICAAHLVDDNDKNDVRALFLAFVGLLAANGAVTGIQLRYWLRPPAGKMHWWYSHMSNMLVACIGTVTAFLVVNVSRLGLERHELYVWLAPGVVGGVGSAVWARYYRRKFEQRGARPES